MEFAKSSSYCRDLVRQHDPDRFLLSLFAPVEVREALWALYAFNYEIAKTREVVSETQLGLIRLQWWREEIGKIYSGAAFAENEILRALEIAIRAYDLPQSDFEALIYGREFDLEDVSPGSVEGTLKYVEATNGSLMGLGLWVMGSRGEGAGVGKRVAMNYGLIGLLRAVPFHAAQGRCYLPQNLLAAAGVNVHALYKGKEVEKIVPVVRELADGFEILTPDPSSPDGLRRRARGTFLKAMQGLAEIYYKQLKYHGFDVFALARGRPPAFKELRVALKSCF